LLSEFWLIQSSLPPIFDVGDILYLRAAKSKPLLFITLLISKNLSSKSFKLEISKKISDNKYDFKNLLSSLIFFLIFCHQS